MNGLQADEPQNDLTQYADFMKGSKNRPRPPKSTLPPLTTTRSTSIRTTVVVTVATTTTSVATTTKSVATTLRSTSTFIDSSIFNEHMKDVPNSLTSNDPLATSWSDNDIPKTELPMHLVMKPIKATQPTKPKKPMKTGANTNAGKYIPTNQVIGMALEYRFRILSLHTKLSKIQSIYSWCFRWFSNSEYDNIQLSDSQSMPFYVLVGFLPLNFNPNPLVIQV